MVENYLLFSEDKFILFLETNIISKTNPEQNKINDSVNVYNDTILHYAVFHNKERLIDFLLEHQADPFKKNKVCSIYIVCYYDIYRENKLPLILLRRKG